MKKGWKIILIIVLITVLMGLVCFGVGMITGADLSHVYSTMDSKYHIQTWYEYGLSCIQQVVDTYNLPF